MMSRSNTVLKDITEKLIDEGNFMPTVKILLYIVEYFLKLTILYM